MEGLDRNTFAQDKKTQQAVILNLILIGEEATKILKDHEAFALQHAHIPWRAMKGMRNRIAHGYFEINLDVVWETVPGPRWHDPSLTAHFSCRMIA